MAKEIKDFEVWHPPKEENEPLVEYEQSWLGFWHRKTTSTGFLCNYFPWYLLIRKKLKYSLLEFWIFTVMWGTSAGLSVRNIYLLELDVKALFEQPFWLFLAVIEYIIFHVHCSAFICVLYEMSRFDGFNQEKSSVRLFRIIYSQLLPLLLVMFICFIAKI